MRKFPGALIFMLGVAVGAGIIFLFQYLTILKRKPECDQLQNQLKELNFRTDVLRLKIQQQDSVIVGFGKVLDLPADTVR